MNYTKVYFLLLLVFFCDILKYYSSKSVNFIFHIPIADQAEVQRTVIDIYGLKLYNSDITAKGGEGYEYQHVFQLR